MIIILSIILILQIRYIFFINVNKRPTPSLNLLVFNKTTFRILHLHTGFNDYSLFWYNLKTKQVMDLLFKKIN